MFAKKASFFQISYTTRLRLFLLSPVPAAGMGKLDARRVLQNVA